MKKKILKNKKLITIVFSLIIMILLIRISYAFYVYSKDTYDIVYNTGKIRMQLSELSDGITLSNQLPISDEDGVDQSTSYNFTVSGYTDPDKPIYYEIVASEGGSIDGKTRFNEEDIKLFLTDNSDNILYGPDIAYKLSSNGAKIYTNSIEGGSVISPITHSYKLKLWISDENILISRTSTSTTKTVYTPEEYNSRYFSIKIKVNSDIDSPKYAGQNILDIINTDLANNLYTPSGDTDQTFIVGKASDNNYKPNNYIWYSGKLWRIVALNKTDGVVTSIKIITEDSMTSIYRNASTPGGSGNSSVYFGSFMYQWFNEDFYATLRNPNNFIVNDYSWNATETTSINKPANTTMVSGNVGSLNLYEYVQSYTNTTAANGYLNNGYQWWLINPYSSIAASNVNYTGAYSNGTYNIMYSIRPSINLKTSVSIVGGVGTSANPYRLAGDNDLSYNLANSNLNTRYSGEYINFNNELYRIVQIENNLTKIVKVDYVKTNGVNLTKGFGTTMLYSQSILDGLNYWGGYLNDASANGWYGSLNTTSQNMVETSDWYLGTVSESSAASYKSSICATVTIDTLTSTCIRTTTKATTKVGLSRLGEMFASQTTGGYTTASRFHLITPYSGSYIYTTDIYSDVSQTTLSNTLSARPAIYLKSNISITGGNGTLNKPFSVIFT